MAGKHRAKKRQPEVYVWLGTGAMTLGLGVALAAGSGVAQADTTNASVSGSRVTPSPGSSAATTSIRTTVSAQSVSTSTHSSTPEVAGEEQATSIVSTKDSVVRQMTPADTGDNDPRDDPTGVEPAARTRQQRSGARWWSRYSRYSVHRAGRRWWRLALAGSQVLSAVLVVCPAINWL